MRDYYLLRIKVEKTINIRENFKEHGIPNETTHINIFVDKDDIVRKVNNNSDGTCVVSDVDFEKSF